jgi:hypothetical protein
MCWGTVGWPCAVRPARMRSEQRGRWLLVRVLWYQLAPERIRKQVLIEMAKKIRGHIIVYAVH